MPCTSHLSTALQPNLRYRINRGLGGVDPRLAKVKRKVPAWFPARTFHAPVTAFPKADSPGYNSNSYTAGLLQATGGTPPPAIRANIRGFTKPVPGQNFDP